jgi:hypothetical protein
MEPTMVDHPVFFRPAEERARVTTLLLWASVVSSGLLTAVAVWDFYLWGNVGIGVDAWLGDVLPTDHISLLLGRLDLTIFLGTAVAFLLWFHRVAANLPALGIRDARWPPGWAVAWWFVPVMSFFRPYQVATDIWQASDPAATAAHWRTRPVKPVLNRWWGYFVASIVVEWMAFCAWTRIDDETGALLNQGVSLLDGAAAALKLVGAWLAVRVIAEIQNRQNNRAQLVAFT